MCPIGWPSACSGRHQPARHHLLDLGMVAAELGELAAAHQIGAAVAGPQHGIARALDDQHDQGRAHALAALLALGQDLAVGGDDRLARPPRSWPRSPLSVAIRPSSRDDPARRPFAALMAAHAVGDRPQAVVVAGDIAVLIVGAHAALMGARPALDPEAASRRRRRALRSAGAGAGARQRAPAIAGSWAAILPSEPSPFLRLALI